MTYIWGRHPVIEALRAGRSVDRIYLAEGTRPGGALGELTRLARASGVPIATVDRRALDRLSETAAHQGVVAEVAEYRYRTLDQLLEHGHTGPGDPLILVLDSLEDPQNFGTLIRTADAVGATGIVIPLHRAAGVTAAVEKASAGAVEHQPIARVTNLPRALEELKGHGFWVVGLDSGGSVEYGSLPVDSPLAVVVGAEGKGLGRLVRETCDLLVRLPTLGKVESLNAAVAGSIVLYDIFQRRRSLSTVRVTPSPFPRLGGPGGTTPPDRPRRSRETPGAKD